MNLSFDPAALNVWRADMDAALRAPEGWLSLVGLLWLNPGENTIGADPACDLQLPGGPPLLGTLTLGADAVLFAPDPLAAVAVNGSPAASGPLRTDNPGPPDRVTSGTLTWVVIRRGARTAVRLWDREHPARAAFGGRVWFAPDPAYQLTARFSAAPGTIAVTNILGDQSSEPRAGYVEFTLNDQPLRLTAQARADGGLFIVFRDATAGQQTYPAARFLSAAAPQDGRVLLDFNRAVSPPCAFTDFATCPLPPPENILPIPILAGERWPGH